MQDQTSKYDGRLALVATINFSYSKCMLHTTYHATCSPHNLLHQHDKCKNYGTTPIMPHGMKKAFQSMKYLQTTKHKTQGKYQDDNKGMPNPKSKSWNNKNKNMNTTNAKQEFNKILLQ